MTGIREFELNFRLFGRSRRIGQIKVHPKWRCVSGLAKPPGRTPKWGTKSFTGSKKRMTNKKAVSRTSSLSAEVDGGGRKSPYHSC
jgi:hypothetical protein